MAASVGRQVTICRPCHVNCPDPMVVHQAVGLCVIGFWERVKEIEEIAPTFTPCRTAGLRLSLTAVFFLLQTWQLV